MTAQRNWLAVPDLHAVESTDVESIVVKWSDRTAKALEELSRPEVLEVIRQSALVTQVAKLRKTSRKAQWAAQRVYVIANRRWGELLISTNPQTDDPEVHEALHPASRAERKAAERARALALIEDHRFDKALEASANRAAGPTVHGTLAEARAERREEVEMRVALSPARVAKLDEYASRRGWTRSEVLGRLIDRLV